MADRIDIGKLQRQEQSSGQQTSFLQQDISLRPFWSNKRKLRFLRSLSVLVNAGLDFRSSLHMAAEEFSKPKEEAELARIIALVDDGKTLAVALESQKGWSVFELENIRIGEASGRLGEVFVELVNYLERTEGLKRQLISVLTYPTFLLLVSFGVVSFMMIAVVPLFEDLFQRFDADLPSITRGVMDASNWVQENFSLILLLIGGIVLLGWFLFKQERFQGLYFKVLFGLPIFGRLVHLTYVGRFCTSMAMLMSAKIPLLDGLRMVSDMLNASPFTLANAEIVEEVNRGKRLSESIAQHSIYPKKVHRFVAIGEEVNRLEEMFLKLSEEYKEEVENRSKMVGKLMEPIIIIFVATFIAIILVALYLPLFQFGKLLG
ncbi:MAG: type II secretion system F family protein [Flavobacteriales bacterium]|nr:type II secretion system F family protein [Flavobacteriales bacterium]